MAQNISIITIDAPIEKVWECITHPAYVKLWQFGSELTCTWEPGSTIRFKTAWGEQLFEQWGKVMAFERPHHLQYSLFAPRPDLEDIPEHYFMMYYSLHFENGQTTLKILQEDNRPGAIQEPQQGAENPILQSLKEIAEKTVLPQ